MRVGVGFGAGAGARAGVRVGAPGWSWGQGQGWGQDLSEVRHRVFVHGGQELLHPKVNLVVAEGVGHRVGQVLHTQHKEADDGVHDDGDGPDGGEDEAVAHEEEREEAHHVEQVEVGPWHGLLE
eukprot:scaffold58158_cov61-Phaeocystis_antarctica.AAC.8